MFTIFFIFSLKDSPFYNFLLIYPQLLARSISMVLCIRTMEEALLCFRKALDLMDLS